MTFTQDMESAISKEPIKLARWTETINRGQEEAVFRKITSKIAKGIRKSVIDAIHKENQKTARILDKKIKSAYLARGHTDLVRYMNFKAVKTMDKSTREVKLGFVLNVKPVMYRDTLFTKFNREGIKGNLRWTPYLRKYDSSKVIDKNGRFLKTTPLKSEKQIGIRGVDGRVYSSNKKMGLARTYRRSRFDAVRYMERSARGHSMLLGNINYTNKTRYDVEESGLRGLFTVIWSPKQRPIAREVISKYFKTNI